MGGPAGIVSGGVLLVFGMALYYARQRGLLGVLQRLMLRRRGVHAVPVVAPTEARAGAVKPRARPKEGRVRVLRGGQALGEVRLPLRGVSSPAEFGEALASALEAELGVTLPFKLYYTDEEGDTVQVNAHTELRELALSTSVTAKVMEAAADRAAIGGKRGKRGGGRFVSR